MWRLSPGRRAGHIGLDDEDLVRPLSGPNHAKFAEIYGAYRSVVWLYCRRRVGAERADDVMGEVFLTVWRRIDQVPAGPETLPWLYRVCHLTISNQWRSAARRWRLESKMGALRVAPPTQVADETVVRDEVRVVVGLLDDLSPSDAEILRLAAWEGLTTAEIGAVLGISPDAAKQRLSRARRRLTDMYEDRYEKRHFIRNPPAQKGGVW
jgi:RNA polymerase sigma-70 factor, ECF subfamily